MSWPTHFPSHPIFNPPTNHNHNKFSNSNQHQHPTLNQSLTLVRNSQFLLSLPGGRLRIASLTDFKSHLTNDRINLEERYDNPTSSSSFSSLPASKSFKNLKPIPSPVSTQTQNHKAGSHNNNNNNDPLSFGFEIVSLVPNPTEQLVAVVGYSQIGILVLPARGAGGGGGGGGSGSAAGGAPGGGGRRGNVNGGSWNGTRTRRKGRYVDEDDNDEPFLECRFSLLSPTLSHLPTSPSISKTLFHPLCPNGTTLLVLTSDAILREYELERDLEEEVGRVEFLKRVPVGSGFGSGGGGGGGGGLEDDDDEDYEDDEQSPRKKYGRYDRESSIANSITSSHRSDNTTIKGFGLGGGGGLFNDDPNSRIAVSFCFGSKNGINDLSSSSFSTTNGSGGGGGEDDDDIDVEGEGEMEEEADWGRMTVYCLMRNGDVYAIIGWLPRFGALNKRYIKSLSALTHAKARLQPSLSQPQQPPVSASTSHSQSQSRHYATDDQDRSYETTEDYYESGAGDETFESEATRERSVTPSPNPISYSAGATTPYNNNNKRKVFLPGASPNGASYSQSYSRSAMASTRSSKGGVKNGSSSSSGGYYVEDDEGENWERVQAEMEAEDMMLRERFVDDLMKQVDEWEKKKTIKKGNKMRKKNNRRVPTTTTTTTTKSSSLGRKSHHGRSQSVPLASSSSYSFSNNNIDEASSAGAYSDPENDDHDPSADDFFSSLDPSSDLVPIIPPYLHSGYLQSRGLLRQGPFLIRPSPIELGGDDNDDDGDDDVDEGACDLIYVRGDGGKSSRSSGGGKRRRRRKKSDNGDDDDHDEKGLNHAGLGMLIMSFMDGRVDFCLEVDRLQPKFDTGRHRRHRRHPGRTRWEERNENLPVLILYESVDLEISGMHPSPSLYSPPVSLSLTLDPLYPDTIYISHRFGLHCIAFGKWFDRLIRATENSLSPPSANHNRRGVSPLNIRGGGALVKTTVRNRETTPSAEQQSQEGLNDLVKMLRRNGEGASLGQDASSSSEVAWIVKTGEVGEGGFIDSTPIAGLIIINDVYLGYALFAVTSQLQAIGIELSLRLADHTTGTTSASSNKTLPSSSNGKSTALVLDTPAYTTLLQAEVYSRPSALSTSTPATHARLTLPSSSGLSTKKEVIVTPESLRFLGSTVQAFRSEIREVVNAGEIVQNRLELQMKEMVRQLEKMEEMRRMIHGMTTSSASIPLVTPIPGGKPPPETQPARLERLMKRQDELLAKADRSLQRLLDKHEPTLSAKEKAWHEELTRLERQVGTEGGEQGALSKNGAVRGLNFGSGGKSLRVRCERVSHQISLLKPQLLDILEKNATSTRRREGSPSVGEGTRQMGLGRPQVKQIKGQVMEESELIQQACEKAEMLRGRLDSLRLE